MKEKLNKKEQQKLYTILQYTQVIMLENKSVHAAAQ